MKYVGLAAENRGGLVLRYPKSTKDTSTTASPIETETLRFTFPVQSRSKFKQKCCALSYENTVVPLKYVDGASTARKVPKRNE